MADLLKQAAARENIENIDCLTGDIERLDAGGPHDVICSFSALEYVADTGALFARLFPLLKPGGLLYVTTARRSLFRFFTQVGNALRQGLWLRAHSRRSIEKALASAGFRPKRISAHLLKCGPFGGMLLEVIAEKGGQ
jgi:2-polyprenyl-3-methyl-5-hydroxy-6-metoxy-1,4-benzoquinol methylase